MKSNDIILFKRFFSCLIILSVLFPVMKVGGFGFKPDLILLLPLTLFFLNEKTVSNLLLIRQLKFLFVALFFSMILSDSLGKIIYGNSTSFIWFPTEFIQIFNRTVVFYIFMCIGFHQIFSHDTFLKIVTSVFTVALFWGVLQSLNIGFVRNLSVMYTLSDVQANSFGSVTRFRAFGTAGNILTWGGLSILFFHFYFFVVKHKLIKYLGMALSVYNVVLTASRSALVALAVSFVVIQGVRSVIIDKKFGLFMLRLTSVCILFGVAYLLLVSYAPDRMELLEYRFLNAEEDLTESGRGAQARQFIGLLSRDNLSYVFGLGKPVVDEIGYMEIEPLYILSSYGIIGVFLHYLLLFFIVKAGNKVKAIRPNYFLFMVASTVGYLVFSLGFFFMREVHSGLPYWWINGFLLGYLFRLRTEAKLKYTDV